MFSDDNVNDYSGNNDICYNIESEGFNALDIPVEGCFSIFYMNSRSLCRHFYDIQDYLSTLTHTFSIYGFSETWFRESPPPYITMANYQLVHSSRSHKLGGGVALFVDNSLKFRVRHDIMPSFDGCESVFIEIERDSCCNLIVGNVYRAPGSHLDNFKQNFDLCLNTIAKEKKLCYVMGDFNLDFLCSDHHPTDDFVNTIYSYGFHPLIDQHTRITPHSSTLIDNILTNNDNALSAGILNTDISDHLSLFQITPSCLLD